MYILAYVLLTASLMNKWGFFGLAAICISCHFAETYLSFIVSALCYTPFCLHQDGRVRVAAIVMVVFYYACGWESALSETYYLSEPVYIALTTVLNLALIFSLLKSGRDGICNTDIDTTFHGLHDNKFNNSHNKITQGRQTT